MQDMSSLPVLEQSLAVHDRFQRLKARDVILEVRNLSKTFFSNGKTTTALSDINFTTYRREFVCVVGASGCGKSTLIRIIAGLDQQTSGDVLLDNKPVIGPGSDRGMVFQGYTLFPWLTVKKNVMFGLEMSYDGKRDPETSALQWLDLIGLSKFANHYPHQLSGGMKQRVAIARSLANQPRILLMDEPFGALDAQTRSRMQRHLMEIWRKIDITIVFVTHDLDEAILLADRILVLKPHPGEVIELMEVPVPRSRTPEDLASPSYVAAKARLEMLIHGSQHAATGSDNEAASDEPFPTFTRLTDVSDTID
ncbi:ABC transporter ATP-binding protein [Hyphomicrobium sp. 802]|uniref:ABC transporter ATP-binding protein n=1 Tax=Hyphomicrobium sp. 802 TaxID=1112272 RepID=UPI00045E72C4|nr:ABC transporter ATP-binding protein [Hyphomicrobium sp. 802]